MSGTYCLQRAGNWFLHSGIQEPSGGVARFYLADLQKNKPVSTEITGYAASALVFLYETTQNAEYLDRAALTAKFLCERAWDSELQTFPFEYPSPSEASRHHAYFFDCGIIVRGLIAVWQITRQERLLDVALAASRGMVRDFHSGTDYHPILELPAKNAAERADTWSRMAGCYQAKSALGWWEVAEATGDTALREAYLEVVNASLETYRDFLPGTPDRIRVMDRLHAYCYLLEALYPFVQGEKNRRDDCTEAYRFTLGAVSRYLRELAPDFARSDVYAQLLRARIYGAPAVPVDLIAASEEALLLGGFEARDDDPRVNGSFWFGRLEGQIIPHANPVSTAFAMQALEVWRAWDSGEKDPCRLPPI